jgi:hypothetical protein
LSKVFEVTWLKLMTQAVVADTAKEALAIARRWILKAQPDAGGDVIIGVAEKKLENDKQNG